MSNLLDYPRGVYTINDNPTLHEVRLRWMIAIDPQQFLQQNGLTNYQVTSFRGIGDHWKLFQALREEQS